MAHTYQCPAGCTEHRGPWPKLGRRPTRAEQVELRYRCGYCEASPGWWCSASNGLPASELHASRWRQATADGALPLAD